MAGEHDTNAAASSSAAPGANCRTGGVRPGRLALDNGTSYKEVMLRKAVG
jgi:hypothetical protein